MLVILVLILRWLGWCGLYIYGRLIFVSFDLILFDDLEWCGLIVYLIDCDVFCEVFVEDSVWFYVGFDFMVVSLMVVLLSMCWLVLIVFMI